MIVRRMLLIVATIVTAAGLWFLFEGIWDRRLFDTVSGRVCVNLSADQANVWLRDHPQTQVLDVRSPSEFSQGALPGAVNISISDEAFDHKVSLFDKTKPVLVYCAGGFRSRKDVARLKDLGFGNIQHIHRGYMSWRAGSL